MEKIFNTNHTNYYKNLYEEPINEFITSEKSAIVTDQDNNKIYLENFNYNTLNNIFKSVGYIKVTDKVDNSYEFSQIYIDTE